MKKILLPLLLMLPLLIQSCYVETPGPSGRDGFDGVDGRDGQDGEDGSDAFVFEYEFTFNRDNYRELLVFPDDFQMLDSDVALVYFLWEIDDDNNEIWRQIPQNLLTPDGLLIYNFDFTKFDTSVFLDAEFNLDLLGSSYLENWVAKVVVVPGNFRGRVDYTNYEEVKEQFSIGDTKLDLSNYGKKPE